MAEEKATSKVDNLGLAVEMSFYQKSVDKWVNEAFGPQVAQDKVKRNYRFFEEAIELVQACDMSREDCLKLIDYVYGRPLGDKRQEVGGVMTTLSALCNAHGISMTVASWDELSQCYVRIEEIRAKQAKKDAIFDVK